MPQTDGVEAAEPEQDLSTPGAFKAMYERHSDELLRYFYKRTADSDVAADLCGETFARALEKADKFDPAQGSQAQWLYGIARHLLVKFWRHRRVARRARRRYRIPSEPIDANTAADLQRTEDIIDGTAAMDALETLSDGVRRAVELRVFDELDYDKIASELGCSTSAARVRVFRGLRELSEVLT